MRSQRLEPTNPSHSATPPLAPQGADLLGTPQARELATRLRAADPLRYPFDAAVRRFVRTERAAGRSLETILDELKSILRSAVDPGLPPAQRPALRTAVTWFAVSEFHRAD